MPPAASALITGITGQDGSFLAELLLEKGYEVTGLVRGDVDRPLGCAEHLREQLQLVGADLLAPDSLRRAIDSARPREIYHLAAPSFVPASWERPEETIAAITGSAAAILQAVRELDASTRVFVSASGAIFGDAPESPQREDTPCRPTTPYAIAKLAAHQLVGALREHDRLHASSGIVYNHESERRPEQFVTRRITRGAAAIALGLQDELTLGNLDAVRDWSFAGDIVYGAWLMLQQDRADDYVLASGMPHTVAELAQAAFECVDLDVERYLRVDPRLIRPQEKTPSVGDPTKARTVLGWEPQVPFEQLVERMVAADLRSLRAAATPS
ncbi:MAG: GDP-mannose 4,6-dehydratase [Solirubrobacterales bacterium]|nr:GDP-mannose 4,6-dehydratase [Solirubrobacterales bacterium]